MVDVYVREPVWRGAAAAAEAAVTNAAIAMAATTKRAACRCPTTPPAGRIALPNPRCAGSEPAALAVSPDHVGLLLPAPVEIDGQPDQRQQDNHRRGGHSVGHVDRAERPEEDEHE